MQACDVHFESMTHRLDEPVSRTIVNGCAVMSQFTMDHDYGRAALIAN